MLRVQVDTSNFDIMIRTLRNTIPNLPESFIKTSADIVEQNLVKNTPVKTGNLRASISKQVEKTNALVYTNTGYGKFVDEDTQPHTIRAKFKEFLRFEIDGKVFFRKQVRHPGTKGQNFKLKTIDDSREPVLAELIQIYRSMTGSR